MQGDPFLGPALKKGTRTAQSEARKKGAFTPKHGIHDWYNGMISLEAVRAGLFDEIIDVAHGLSTDGFEAWRQRGSQGWAIIVTVLNLSPGKRTQNDFQIVVSVTLGPKQPTDLVSFLNPLVEELNFLARGISGVRAFGSPNSVTLRANVVQITGDTPAIEKLLNFSGHNDFSLGRNREYHGYYHAPSKQTFFHPTDPTDPSAVRFYVDNCTVPRRTADSISRDASVVEEAKSTGRSLAYQHALSKKSGVKGHSLLFAPSEAMRRMYPHLVHFWSIIPAAAPYNIMHLLLQNVAPHPWRLFAGLVPVAGEAEEDYVMPKACVAIIGREIACARRTVPRARARALRNNYLHHRSYKAADWMYWLHSSAEVLLVGRNPEFSYDIFMSLCRACRLLMRPTGLTPAELAAVDADLKHFVRGYYASIYRGTWERLPLCWSVIAAILDIVENVRACWPAWVSWQFPTERKIGELGTLIHSRSKPSENLSVSLHRRYQAELVPSFGNS